jgi:hypothetical protein
MDPVSLITYILLDLITLYLLYSGLSNLVIWFMGILLESLLTDVDDPYCSGLLASTGQKPKSLLPWFLNLSFPAAVRHFVHLYPLYRKAAREYCKVDTQDLRP